MSEPVPPTAPSSVAAAIGSPARALIKPKRAARATMGKRPPSPIVTRTGSRSSTISGFRSRDMPCTSARHQAALNVLEQDAERGRRRAAVGEQSLCHAEVDLLRGRQLKGIGVRVAGPSQRGETPVEKLAFGQVAPLLLSGRHVHTVGRSAPV